MIHIAVGTKAQCIKLAPILQKLQRDDIAFNLIDLGQHSLITRDLRDEFNLKEPDVYLSKGENIACMYQGILWLIRIFLKSLSPRWIKKNIFLSNNGVCLIHGDTISTLIGLYLAKMAHLKVAHIEAGLRSFSWFSPFPEEIVRVIAMRFSDMLFTPSQWAFDNLVKMGLKEKAVLISANTSLESTLYSLNKKIDLGLPLERFALFTVHRMENIFSRKRLEFIINLISKISDKLPVVFIQHPPTIHQLKKHKLQTKLDKQKNIYFYTILSHAHFINLLNSCEFVVTDGGSIQEESFYLGKPCLLLRRRTERKEGLGENVVLSNFNERRIDYFIDHCSEFKREARFSQEPLASYEIVNRLYRYV